MVPSLAGILGVRSVSYDCDAHLPRLTVAKFLLFRVLWSWETVTRAGVLFTFDEKKKDEEEGEKGKHENNIRHNTQK